VISKAVSAAIAVYSENQTNVISVQNLIENIPKLPCIYFL